LKQQSSVDADNQQETNRKIMFCWDPQRLYAESALGGKI